MKKYCIAVLVFTLAAANMTACGVGENDESKNENTDLNNSSYYSVNYTDVGDESSSRSNVSESVGRSQPEQKTNSDQTVKEADQNSKNFSSENVSEPEKSSSAGSSGITNKTTVTYYYTDDAGEQHATDTEIDVSTDINDSSDNSKIFSENKTSSSEDEQINTDSDVQSEAAENNDPDSEKGDNSDIAAVSQGYFAEEDLVFYYNGSPIMLGENIDDVVAAIGEPDSPPDSTANDSKDYSYDGFNIEAVSGVDDSVFTVLRIKVYDRSLSTGKGVHIDMTVEDVRKIYGQEDEIADGEYRYYSGDRYLFLGVQNDVVSDFGYRFVDNSANDEIIL